jgi:hypothetical protein
MLPIRRLSASSCCDVELRLRQIIVRLGRGRSRPEWIAKIGLVVEEADETVL